MGYEREKYGSQDNRVREAAGSKPHFISPMLCLASQSLEVERKTDISRFALNSMSEDFSKRHEVSLKPSR